MTRFDAVIGALASGGDGVAHVDWDGERRAIFVPRTAPGDHVRLEANGATRPARGRIVELLAPGPDRIASACPWSTRCGGCDWMHLSTDAQRRAHAELVRAALPPSWSGVALTSFAAPPGTATRTRTRVHVRCGRGGRVTAGMYEAGTHDPVEVGACAVLDPALESARTWLPTLFRSANGRGDVQLALGVLRRPVLDIRWQGTLANSAFGALERAVHEGRLAGARVREGAAARPAVVGDPTPWMLGADGAPLKLPPGGFAQASETCNAELGRHVIELTAAAPANRVVELFAGSGNLSVLLATTESVEHLVCVESDRDACDAMRRNLGAREVAGPSLHRASVRVVEADAAAYDWSPATKLVILDPPRTGAREVAERLRKSRVARVIYVSCDPQTLGRDLSILDEAYTPASAATFEMFAQTSHVETVVAMDRKRP